MKKFLLNLLFTVLGLMIIAFAVDHMITEGLKKSNYRETSKWNEVVEGGIDAKVLVLGSSRALVHFDCEVISEFTNQSCYNLGIDGSNIQTQTLMLELYLGKNKLPKELIWVLDLHSFSYTDEVYGFEQMIPYTGQSEIRQILNFNKVYSRFYYHLPIIRYKFVKHTISKGILSYLNLYKRTSILKSGYRPMKREWDYSFEAVLDSIQEQIEYNIDNEIISDFKNKLNEIKGEGIKISFVYAPQHIDGDKIIKNRKEIIDSYRILAQESDIDFFDYSKSEINQNREYFYNSNHLNKKGVDIWMQIFLKDFYE